ncbi:MAG: molybdenum cofactor biosynthesis protein MoaE [bacterium]
MFVITEERIDGPQVRTDLRDESCGAIVTFKGRVRDHNLGRTVTKLHYEAYRTLAVTEGETILQELRDEYDIHKARAYHRIGELTVTELSFWLGVTAPHRQAAFRACKDGVDRIKDRVPIWKKEYYEDGSSTWINQPSELSTE